MTRILLLTLLLLAFASAPLYAQESQTVLSPPETTEEAPETPSPYEDVPDEYLIEAQNYFESCEADSNISQYYDCRCMAAQYLDERIKTGPKTAPSSITMEIGRGCMDEASIAGNTYEECLSRAPVLPKNMSVEKYCSCYANSFARIYSRSGVELSSKSKIKIQAQAGVICEDPALGRKLYPQAYGLSRQK